MNIVTDAVKLIVRQSNLLILFIHKLYLFPTTTPFFLFVENILHLVMDMMNNENKSGMSRSFGH